MMTKKHLIYTKIVRENYAVGNTNPVFTKELFEKAIKTMKGGLNKQPLSMSRERFEDFKKLPIEEQKELLELYQSF